MGDPNPVALRKLVGAGAQLRTIYESRRTYRDEEYLWFRAAELSFANLSFPASAQR